MAQKRELSSPLDLLHRASQVADKLFVSHVGTQGLTPRQFAVLKAVSDADGLSQTDIMMATGIDRSSTSELVRRLVTVGLLVRRRTKTDARQYAVRLTPKGRQARAGCDPAARAADQALLAIIPTSDRGAFLKALGLLATTGLVRG